MCYHEFVEKMHILIDVVRTTWPISVLYTPLMDGAGMGRQIDLDDSNHVFCLD